MKFIKIKLLMLLGLLLQVGIGFPYSSAKASSHGGPTREDILASRGQKQVCKGSSEHELISAVKDNNLEEVETLINKNPDLDLEATDSHKTALMIAAKMGNYNIATKLIDAGANVSANGDSYLTVLICAVDGNNIELIKLLISKLTEKGRTEGFGDIFVQAASKRNEQVVEALLKSNSIDKHYLETAMLMVPYGSKISNAIKEHLNKRSN